ncbi:MULTISPECIES: hypothetical protein [unclassified Rhodococcus (in: high G+C Gram-positive bacteria)]|uniref:hypothetical protein n=1 Tax=unclassified Rhodococcus (in: high G+C Gram-positive bacteria) TaxID=192944 RepID=UPI0020788A78|nr:MULTISPECIES: hypothetical protein [unclassified Rhodococcus (in: high G+C Gram-positive bacteria)]
MGAPANRSGGESGRWDPTAELTDSAHRIGPLRDSMLGASPGGGQAWRPLAEVSETDDGYVMEVGCPG